MVGCFECPPPERVQQFHDPVAERQLWQGHMDGHWDGACSCPSRSRCNDALATAEGEVRRWEQHVADGTTEVAF